MVTPDETEIPAAPKRRYKRRQVKAQAELDLAEEGLQDEIRMMRLIVRRVLELADEGLALAEVMRVLDTVGRASTRISGLIRQQKLLGAGDQDVAKALSQALSEVTRGFKLG